MTGSGWLIVPGTCAFAVIRPSPVAAHAPIEGLGTFYSYFLHPIIVPETALLVAGTALLLGQQGRTAARMGVGGIALGLVTGLGLIGFWPTLSVDQRFLLAAAATVGGALCADRPLPHVLLALLAFATGAVVSLDPDLATFSRRDALLAAAGLAGGTLLFIVIVAGLSTGSQRPWLLIGRRIAGAWIVTAAILVLALAAKAAA